MVAKRLVILGSTGSIGKSTLEVIAAHPGAFEVRALAAYRNVKLLAEQCRKYRPEYVCIVDDSRLGALKDALAGEPIKILAGVDEMISLTRLENVDTVVNAVVGAAGMKASLETVRQGRSLALANKESLVCGGPLFPPILKKTGGKILPIDSEHSAIWQALAGGREHELKHIIITASGGPFRDLPIEKFHTITAEQALNHPTWKMGPKITIDSATLANKGLEVIEAVVLFSIPVDRVKVVIHPQSIIHSMVEFIDSSILAQMSRPDMKLPITYALFWPERVKSDFGQLDLSDSLHLTFEPPDLTKFRALGLAYEVASSGGTAPTVFNAANEVAVAAFLESAVKFTDITDIVDNTLQKVDIVSEPQLDDILQADQRAREFASEQIRK
ncbi:MAG TPA: 1-deoxy-D-xylulose-5-phosphate reductoisomerase [candidate division Zixibacteria bacterium]|nr:1-deoxy-D-xylulose-5-phosphate reductoisomerase [candidate division Zixibacteria bacterium]